MPARFRQPGIFSSRIPVILQSETAECGLACLAMVASRHGHATDLTSLRKRWSVSLKGVNLAQLMNMAQSLDLASRAVRLELEDIELLRFPAILHWDLDHFVVLERVSRNHAHVIDPAFGRRKLTLDEFSSHFTGVAIELTPTVQFERKDETVSMPLSSFFRGVPGLAGALVRILSLSLALQVFVLLAPLFSQLVLDEIVVTADRDLLTVLGAIFLLLAAIRICIEGIRGWLVIALGAALQFGWSARLFHHLLRLPLDWFEKRHIGDVVSRFGSIRAVEELMAKAVVEALVDGLMALTTLSVMLYYSMELTAVVVVAVLLYFLLRSLLFYPLRRNSYEALVLGAKENSVFMESVRAILPLKCFGREALRESTWQNRKTDSLNAEIRVGRLKLIQQIANTGIFAFENVAVLWLGALAVIGGELTIGMLVAFVAYKTQFGSRMAALVDKLIQYRLVGLHLERIADIALSSRDPGIQEGNAPVRDISGSIEARNLHFRYADTDPYVIEGFGFKSDPGECIAITAPSGAGKSTLIKLLMGLLPPTKGMIMVDEVDIARAGHGNYRRSIAAVMQDDGLFTGTIEENIACFDPKPDRRFLHDCAKKAAIDTEIERLPMGWNTQIGDMGSTLSGGQKQRVLLARALYARPRILFLDEATSHLDPGTERTIHESLGSMQITRILVAHRRETLAITDRVINLA